MISAWPVTRSTLMSPAPLLRISVPASSSWMSPRPVLIRQSPSRPSLWQSAERQAMPCTFEPAGSSIVTSIELPPLRIRHWRSFGALTSSWPSVYSTRVSSAALTSSSLAGSLGRTSTTVAPRSVGGDPQSPRPRSIVAVIGSGVSKVGMGMSSCKVRFGVMGWLRRRLTGGSAHPAGEGLADPAAALAAGGGRRARARPRRRGRATR